MAFLRRSLTKATPFTAKLIGSQRNTRSAAAATVKRAIVSPRFISHRPALYSAGTRLFSSATATDGGKVSSDKKLIEVVQAEIDCALESEDHGQTADIPDDFPFSIEDNPGEQTVILTREYNGETVTVQVSMPDLGVEEDEGEDDEGDAQADSSVPLIVTITKEDGNAPRLEFDCTAFPDEVRINGLSLKNTGNDDQLAYEGPDFFDLDENLQKAFHKYLEIRGVKPSTTNFLHEYMIGKDHAEYVRWLTNVKNFVEA